MECTSRPPQMPRQASKNGGRSGHGLRFHCGAAAPEAVMQLKAGQRHAPSRSCTPEPRFRAHARPPHMCGPRTAPDPRSESEQTSPQVFVRATLLSTRDKTPTPFVSRPAGPVGRPATGQTPPARRHFVRVDRAVRLRKGIERWHAREEAAGATAPANGAATGYGCFQTRRPACTRWSGERTAAGSPGRWDTASG